jgi:hypothetical protein
MSQDEELRRLNATERLSAKQARYGAMSIDVCQESFGETDMSIESEVAHRAYADIREGK